MRQLGANSSAPLGDKDVDENFVENLQTSLVPYVVGQLFGCDVVMDDDQALEQAQTHTLNEDDLKNLD